MSAAEKRRNKRFELRLPIELIRLGGQDLGRVSETANVSSSGVLFSSEAQFPVGEPIEYLITLQGEYGGAVQLRCVGKVVRMEKKVQARDKNFRIAATLERYEFVRV
ncbi:MAG: PilZ domain-containing protein [Bryobacteraceae bacterium]